MSDPDQPHDPSPDDGGESGSEARPPAPPPGWGTPSPASPVDPPQLPGTPAQPYGPPPGHEPTRPLDDPWAAEPTRRFDVPPPAPGAPPQYSRYPAPGQPAGYGQPYGPGYGSFGPVTNQKAAWALGSGLASILLVCCFPLFGLGGIAGIVLAIQARKEIAASGGRQTGDGLAIAGLVTGIVAVLVGAGFVLFFGLALLAGW